MSEVFQLELEEWKVKLGDFMIIEKKLNHGLYSISLRRRITKNAIEIILLTMTVLILLPLISILYEILSNGLPVIINNPNFLTENTAGPSYSLSESGISNAILGSIVVTIIACIFSIPIGILAGIHLSKSNPKSDYYNSTIRLIADILQSTPSIIAGLVIYFFWVVPNGTNGFGVIAGGMSLALLMLPIVTRVTEEGIRTVPTSIHEAAISLGIPEWRIMTTIVLRTASPIVLTGIMLGVARITGETAPFIFTMGDTNFGWSYNNFSPSLTIKLFRYASSPFSTTWVPAGWAMATVLLIMVLGINILIRTNILSNIWKNKMIKQLLTELSIIGAMIVVNSMFGNLLLMLVMGITLKILFVNILLDREIYYKIIDFKIMNYIPLGLMAVIAFFLEMVLEILLFIAGLYTNYIYVLNYMIFLFSFILGVLFLFYSFFKNQTVLLKKIYFLTELIFCLILLEIASFRFGGTSFYIGNIIYFVFLVSVLLRLFIYNIIISSKITYNYLLNHIYTKILMILEIIEVSIQAVLVLLDVLFNKILNNHIYLFTNYVYVINYSFSLILIGLLIFYLIVIYFKNQKTNTDRVISLLYIFISLVCLNFVLPLSNELFSEIIFGLLLKTLLIFLVIKSSVLNSIKNKTSGKFALILITLETFIELILFFLNYSINTVTNFVFNVNYFLIIVIAFFIIFSILNRYKINETNVNSYV